MPAVSTPSASARSPFAGCAILITALLVMVFLVVFSIFSLFRQFDEIVKFTSDKPQTLEVTALENREGALNSLAERLEGFRQQLDGDAEATLALTPEDLNLAIAAYPVFKDLRGTFRVLSAGDDTLRIAISFPLNGRPRLAHKDEKGLIATDPRHLNGTLVARPTLLQHELVLKLDDLLVPGASVPREFIDQMSPYRITERYLQHPVLGPAMAKLTGVAVADGRLVLRRVPGESPAGAISDEQVDGAGGRLFTVLGSASLVFLFVAGAVVVIGLRAKSARP